MNCKNCNSVIVDRKATAEFCCKRCRNTYGVRCKRQRRMERLKKYPLAYKLFRKQENERQLKFARNKGVLPKPRPTTDRKEYRRDRKEYMRQWEKDNSEKVALNRAKQENRRRGLPHSLTVSDWSTALEYFNGKCAYCREPLSKVHKEHFIPAKHGGGLTKNNIVPSCPDCNRKKSSKNPLEWLAHNVVAYVRVTEYLKS